MKGLDLAYDWKSVITVPAADAGELNPWARLIWFGGEEAWRKWSQTGGVYTWGFLRWLTSVFRQCPIQQNSDERQGNGIQLIRWHHGKIAHTVFPNNRVWRDESHRETHRCCGCGRRTGENEAQLGVFTDVKLKAGSRHNIQSNESRRAARKRHLSSLGDIDFHMRCFQITVNEGTKVAEIFTHADYNYYPKNVQYLYIRCVSALWTCGMPP